MSMNESEERLSSTRDDLVDFARCPRDFADSFSADEAVFVQELEALFLQDKGEEMPPPLVQTPQASADPHSLVVDDAFVHKTRARVMRQLQLKRRLYQKPSFTLHSVKFAGTLPRSVMRFCAVCLLFMMVTAIVSGPAFVAGWAYLWSGAPAQYASKPSPIARTSDRQMNLMDAQALLHFPLSWPYAIPDRYTASTAYIYADDQIWADGPVAALTFTFVDRDGFPRQITICQFKPQGQVVQIMQKKTAQQIKIGNKGSSVIYVEGQWSLSAIPQDTEASSQRSELVYEDQETGVVFWIVGDNRDGIDSQALAEIAASLRVFETSQEMGQMGERFDRITQAVDGIPWQFAQEVLHVKRPDNAAGLSFYLVNAAIIFASSVAPMKPS